VKKYFCPYCNPKYQFHKKDNLGNLYCGLCGEYLIKKNPSIIKKSVVFIAIISFVMPFLYLLAYSIKDYKNHSNEYFQARSNFQNNK
tara:strand:- start:973 stop:1233 length:261 start_codon:yes stop_codon:yes gene_type:complete